MRGAGRDYQLAEEESVRRRKAAIQAAVDAQFDPEGDDVVSGFGAIIHSAGLGFTHVLSASTLDWVFRDGSHVSPQESNYAFDAHYLWRDFDKRNPPEEHGMDYADHMPSWKPDLYKKAVKAAGRPPCAEMTRTQARKFIQVYYEGKYECIGFALSCNHSSGYHIPIFWYLPVKPKKVKTKKVAK